MEHPLSKILSLPYELVQSMLQFIVNFEPWTYASTPEQAEKGVTDEDLLSNIRDIEPLKYTSQVQQSIGLSSESSWLPLTLSRHPYHLNQSEKTSVSSAITQALRRMNARLERLHWEERPSVAIPLVTSKLDTTSASKESILDPLSATVSKKQYHARMHTEEEARTDEAVRPAQKHTPATAETLNPSTALVVYSPASVLKLSALDIKRLSYQHEAPVASSTAPVFVLAVLLILLQYHADLLSSLEQLSHDLPLPSIEHDEHRDIVRTHSTPPRDRHRSMSGSTVAEIHPHEETLSFSPVVTMYNSFSVVAQEMAKEEEGGEKVEVAVKGVRWAGKRESEERDVDKSAKRPKLSEYKQVSSGRVATLMERFEGFHI